MNKNQELSQKLYQLGQELINHALLLDKEVSISNNNNNNNNNTNVTSPSSINRVVENPNTKIRTAAITKPTQSVKTYIYCHRGRWEARYKVPNDKVQYLASYKTKDEAKKALDQHIKNLHKKVAASKV